MKTCQRCFKEFKEKEYNDMQFNKLILHLFKAIFVFSLIAAYGCASTTPVIIKAAGSGDVNTVKRLNAEGQNINETDSDGTTALIHAVFSKNPDVVKYLIESGADIKAKDRRGRDALSYAVELEQLELISVLISKGADIESKDFSGLTPLVYAALYASNADVIKLLIESGADLKAKSSEGETVLDLALSSTRGKIVDDLIRAGVNLWEPEAGKARLFFVGTGLWDYLTVSVGKQNKKLNQVLFMGLAYIDVDTGKHTISVSGKEASSIDAIAGQTYYLEVTQDMKRRAWHYAGIKLSSVMITPLTEVEAKQKIKEILKSKELSEAKKSNTSVATEITKPTLHKPTEAEVKKNSLDSSEYAQRLRELKKLKDEGLLTDDEYERKRKSIVDGI